MIMKDMELNGGNMTGRLNWRDGVMQFCLEDAQVRNMQINTMRIAVIPGKWQL